MTIVTKKKFNWEDFPEITVCPNPSVNTEALNSYGYSNLWDYKNGFVKKMNLSKNQISWRGNNSETTVKDIYNDISIIKRVEDCPNYLSALWYTSRNNKGFGIQSLNFTVAMVMYPDNRCCKAVIPNMTDVGLIKGVRFFFSSKNKPYDFVKVYLTDQISKTFFSVSSSEMSGDKIIAKDPGSSNYKVKLVKKIHVEGDPNFQCTNYRRPGLYDACLERAMINRTKSTLGCIPPWMSHQEVSNSLCNGTMDNGIELLRRKIYHLQELWCLNVTKIKIESLNWVLWNDDINVGESPRDSCLNSCTSTRFHVTDLGL